MGLSPILPPAVLDALRSATLSDDGLTLTLHGQLDADTYRRVKKALDTYGGKWNRKAGTHDFTKDFRPHLEHLLAGGKVGADNGGKNPLAFFPTPEPVIREMCKRIWPWPDGSRFLEPSAGEGAIADFLWNRHSVYADCVELDEDRAQTIRAKGFKVVGSDFLQFTLEQPYDYVLMNPPFTVDGDTQAYISHIEHALTCLRPGGDLVAVVPGSFAWLSRKRVAEFRTFCEKHAQSPLQEIAPGAFKASGTDIATCLIHITKPEEAEMPSTTKKTTDTETPDFAAMAQATREKMGEKLSQDKSRVRRKKAEPETQEVAPTPVDSDLPFPVGEAELDTLTEALAELPGTPVLLPTSGVQMIPWKQIDPSPLNPRKKFDEAALRELAIDIERKGVLQNLVARPRSTGRYEIAAGERRYRAVSLLVTGFEEGGVRHQVTADFQLPVLVRELSDRELLEVATAENVQRRRMTPMEEAEAFAAIAAQGATPAEIAHKFGYAERTVTRRIQIAQNLSDAVKEAFDKGEVTLEKAEILALAPKKQQKALLDSVRYYGGASELRNAISKQAFQVANALFDTALYSGEIVEDLFGDVPAYFQDAKQAAELQTQHLEGLAKEAEAGGAAFAQVVVHNGAYFNGNFEFPLREGATGQVWVMDTRTGKVEHLTGRVRRADEVAERPTVQRAEYGWQNRNLAKKLKDEAVITALYANPRLTQAAFVASQLVGYSDFGVECPSPEMVAVCEQAAELSGGVLARPDSVEEGLLVVGSLPLTEEERAEVEAEAAAEGGEVDWDEVATDPYPEDAVLGALLDLPEDVLGQLVLIGLLDSACHTELMDPLAHRTGASIAGKVEITGELLAPMNRPALIEVAVEAGLEAEEVSKQSDDEIRACLLEVASDLKAEGFVPSFMDFERPEQDSTD
ncbi:ParB/RepB/Spo0J family partition protein [Deinococcus sp. VB142]|uniref:ParB/RepB/Spo0J family partition protein n=1 Tax=Deinococcus sp. VB142 TaxID=3112952 RepID=A0AAU6Q4G0_9DEIO